MEGDVWSKFSLEYDSLVFSLTRIAARREQIMAELVPGNVLNAGCGSTDHLNKLLNGRNVIAADFCKEMLDVANHRYSNRRIHYCLADNRSLPFLSESFDNVISVNSILPPKRHQVSEMFGEIRRVLRKDGRLIAFLPSYDTVVEANEKLGLGMIVDESQQRVMDTTGWQCYHTIDSVKELMKGFRNYEIRTVSLDTEEEKAEIRRLYGVDAARNPPMELLLVARG